MHKYKLLILDYGGVYSFSYDQANFDRIMQIVFGKEPTVPEGKKISLLSRELGSNEIQVGEYVDKVANILGTTPIPSIELFQDTTISFTSPPSLEMRELVDEARESNTKVSLLSDMYEFEIKLTKPTGRYDGFDYASFSAEIGVTKHNPKAFQATLDHFHVSSNEALFVDDVLEYTKVASSIGIDVIWVDKNTYKTPEQLAQAILVRLRR